MATILLSPSVCEQLMARQPRLDLPRVAQHIVQRGNDRQACFAADSDYTNYLQELREAAYRWSSNANNALGIANPILTEHDSYLALSFSPEAL